MSGIDYQSATLGMGALDKALLDITRSADAAITRATELGATEAELTRIRTLGNSQAAIATKDAAYGALDRAVAAQKTILDKSYADQTKHLQAEADARKKAAQAHVDAAQSAYDGIKGIYDALASTSDSLIPQTRAQAQAVLQNALSVSAAGGSLSGVSGLTEALRTVGQSSEDIFSTYTDYTATGRLRPTPS